MAAIKKGASYDEVMQAVAEGDQDAIEVASSGGLASSEERGETAKKRTKILLILGAMGPGVVSAMAGNDAGGISTYSTAGADFGYATLWVIPVMCVLLMVVQMTAARMGAVTGKGFAALIRERFGIRLTALAMGALLVGNVATTFSEFAGIASGMELFGIPRLASVPVAALVVWLLVVKGSYKSVEKIFLAVSLVFVTYVVAAFLAGPNWGDVAQATVIPQVPADTHFVSLVIAMIGTTIAPWMMFFTQSNVVDKGITDDRQEMMLQKVDVATGTIVACLVAWFIIITTGAVSAGYCHRLRSRCGQCFGSFRRRVCADSFCGGVDGGKLFGCLRASSHDVLRHLRGVRLGGGRRFHLERSPHVQGHLHVGHRLFRYRCAHPQPRSYGDYAYGPVYQRRDSARFAGLHGSYCGG